MYAEALAGANVGRFRDGGYGLIGIPLDGAMYGYAGYNAYGTPNGVVIEIAPGLVVSLETAFAMTLSGMMPAPPSAEESTTLTPIADRTVPGVTEWGGGRGNAGPGESRGLSTRGLEGASGGSFGRSTADRAVAQQEQAQASEGSFGRSTADRAVAQQEQAQASEGSFGRSTADRAVAQSGANRLGGEPAEGEENKDPAPARSAFDEKAFRAMEAAIDRAIEKANREIERSAALRAAHEAQAEKTGGIQRAYSPNLDAIELDGSKNNSGRVIGAYEDRAVNPAFKAASSEDSDPAALGGEYGGRLGGAPVGVGTGFSFSGSNPGFAAAIDAARFGGSPSAQSMGYGVVGVNVGEIDGLIGAGTMNSAASSNPAFGGSAALQGFAQNAFAQEVAPSFGSAPSLSPGFAPDPTLEASPDGYGGREGERGQGFSSIGVDTSSRGEGRSVGTAGTGGSGNAFETGGGGYARGSSAPNASEGPTFNPADGSITWGGGDVTPGSRGGQAMNTNGETDYGQTSESNTSEKNAFDRDLDAEKDKDLDFGGNAFGSDFGLDLGGYA